jgi:hypothetical protein
MCNFWITQLKIPFVSTGCGHVPFYNIYIVTNYMCVTRDGVWNEYCIY